MASEPPARPPAGSPFGFVLRPTEEMEAVPPGRFLPQEDDELPGFSRFALTLHPPERTQLEELRQYKALCNRLLPGTRYGSHLYRLVHLDKTTFSVTLAEYGEVIGGATVRLIQATSEPVIILDVLLLAVEQAVLKSPTVCGRGYATRIMNYLRALALALAKARGCVALLMTQSDTAGGATHDVSIAMSFWSRQQLRATPQVPMLLWLLPHSQSTHLLEIGVSLRAQQMAVTRRDMMFFRSTRHTRRVTIVMRGAHRLLPPIEPMLLENGPSAITVPAVERGNTRVVEMVQAACGNPDTTLACKRCGERDESVCFFPFHHNAACMHSIRSSRKDRAVACLRSARKLLVEAAVGSELPDMDESVPNDALPICVDCVEVALSGGALSERATQRGPSSRHDDVESAGKFCLKGNLSDYDCQGVIDRLVESSRRWRDHQEATALKSNFQVIHIRLKGKVAHVSGVKPSLAACSRHHGPEGATGRGGRKRGHSKAHSKELGISIEASKAKGSSFNASAPPNQALNSAPPSRALSDAPRRKNVGEQRSSQALHHAWPSSVTDRHAKLAAAVAAASGPMKKKRASSKDSSASVGNSASLMRLKRKVHSGDVDFGASRRREADCAKQQRRGYTNGVCSGDGTDTSEAIPLNADSCQPVSVTIAGEGVVNVVKILKHHVYGGAQVGSLFNVYVRVLCEGGRRSNGFIQAEALAGSHVLDKYVKTDNGRKIAKYAFPDNH